MSISSLIRLHLAGLRALLVLTVITGAAYPLLIWGVAQIPGLRDKAEGSVLNVHGKPVGSSLIGQAFLDSKGNAISKYFQSRPSAAGTGYDPTASGASNLGPENVIDTPGDPKHNNAGYKPSLLTAVCQYSIAVGKLENIDASRPFCTDSGVGAVLLVFGRRDVSGHVPHPDSVISANEPCGPDPEHQALFRLNYEGVEIDCAKPGEDYSKGQIVPVYDAGVKHPLIPPDAVTASASGLDPHISTAYADIQVPRIANARHISEQQVRDLVHANTSGRDLGFLGEPRVNVLELNIALDERYPTNQPAN